MVRLRLERKTWTHISALSGRDPPAIRRKLETLNLTLPKVPRSDSWSEQDLRLICDLRRSGVPTRELAKRLGRTQKAVRNKLDVQGVILGERILWTEEDKALLLEMQEKRVPHKERARRLGRSTDAVKQMLIRMRDGDKKPKANPNTYESFLENK